MKSFVSRFACVAIAGLILSSCDQQAPTPPADASPGSSANAPAKAPAAAASSSVPAGWQADPQARLVATPNPVPANGGLGTTTLSWATGGRPTSALYVTTDGGPETLFAEGSEGSSEAPWIQTGHTYEFHLYTGTDRNTLLSKLTVTRAP